MNNILTTLSTIPLTLGINLGTAHFEPGYRSDTTGIYLRASDTVIGRFRNSLGVPSNLLGITFRTPMHTETMIGIATGYALNPSGIPILTVGRNWKLNPIQSFRASIIPPTSYNAGAVTFSLEYHLK